MTEAQESKFVTEIENAMHASETGKIPAQEFFTIGKALGILCREVVDLKAKHFSHLKNVKTVGKRAAKKAKVEPEPEPIVEVPVAAPPVPKKKAKNYNTPKELLKEAEADLASHLARIIQLENPPEKKGKWFVTDPVDPKQMVPIYKKIVKELEVDIRKLKKQIKTKSK
jgi:hypothetical protein